MTSYKERKTSLFPIFIYLIDYAETFLANTSKINLESQITAEMRMPYRQPTVYMHKARSVSWCITSTILKENWEDLD